MKSHELQQRLLEIDSALKALGDLNSIVQLAPGVIQQLNAAQQKVDTLVPSLTALQKSTEDLIEELDEAKTDFEAATEDLHNRTMAVSELEAKVQDLIEKTTKQLARAADEKLANAFEEVKVTLIKDRQTWFYYLLGSVGIFLVALGSVTWWQVHEIGTLYHWAFPIRILLTSPLIFLVLFVVSEFSRVRSLIEEYTFKSAIALNFEAYKEVLDETFKGQPGDILKSELEFVIESVRKLYSSPMENIRKNSKKGGRVNEGTDMIKTVKEVISLLQPKE